MKCKGLIVAALLLATPLCANAERGFVSNSKDVTFSITSPQDGSLWIATESRGLIRLGATGRTFAYSSATGDFPCDSISALAFDSAGILYMKDSRGDIYSYTTLYGFKLQKEAPADVVFEGVEKGEPVSLPSREPSTPYRNHPTWPYLVVIVLLCVVIVYTRVLAAHKPAKPEKVNNAPQPVPEPKVELKTIEKPEQETPIGSSDSEFVSRVESLVASNFTDPGYSVETLADSLGITRVHLNRKLKEAGAPSPKTILKKARMEKALAMLREGRPVSDVYLTCGFSSASYFSSAFKEYFGYSPSDVTKPNL